MILPITSFPSLVLLNARSLCNKIDELRLLTDNLSPNCIAVTESWLNIDIPDDYVDINNYVLFRCDRFNRQGGGVCIYLHCNFKPLLTQQFVLTGVESLCVRLPAVEIIVWCMYVPPNLSSVFHQTLFDSMTQHVDTLLDDHPNSKLIICGDFNDFSTEGFQTNFLCLNRVNSPTRGSSFLDQIWLSEALEEAYPDDAEIGPPLSTSDHNTAFLKPHFSMPSDFSTRKIVFDFRKSHIQDFLNRLSTLGFEGVYATSDVNEKCSHFYETLTNALSTSIPQREVTLTNRDKPWITPILKRMIEDRWTAYRTRNWPLYNHLKSKVKSEIVKAKKLWSKRLLQRDKNIWNIVRELQGKKQSPSLPESHLHDYAFLDNLSSSFAQCFNQQPDAKLEPLSASIWDAHVEPREIHHLLTKLKLKQSTGSDGIPARVLRVAADILCTPLADIFQASIDQGIFPVIWKFAIIRPIPKSKNPTKDQYRPISLLPILSKVFERVVLSFMKDDFVKHFGNNQHAFRPHGSTVSALIDIHNFITLSMENPATAEVRVTCLDFTKAFDKLQHNRLINYMKAKNLNHGFLNWLSSFLCNRSQHVSLGGMSGPLMLIPSGVPQGSVLGPYLFGFFISSLKIQGTNVKLVKYADDLTLIEVRTATADFERNALQAIESWAIDQGMILNPHKTQHLLIRRTRAQTRSVPSTVSILGVTLSSRLKWDSHFDRVTLVATRRLYILRSLKSCLNRVELFQFFQASVLSAMLYASPLFGELPVAVLRKIERVCRRAHRIVCDRSCHCFIMPDITSLREKLAIKLLLSCENPAHPLHCYVPERLPATHHFRLPFSSTSRRQNSFIPHTCALANQLNRRC